MTFYMNVANPKRIAGQLPKKRGRFPMQPPPFSVVHKRRLRRTIRVSTRNSYAHLPIKTSLARYLACSAGQEALGYNRRTESRSGRRVVPPRRPWRLSDQT